MAVPKKYEHIDFTPPESVAKAAERGLELRQKASPSNRGGLTPAEAAKQGIGSGVQRAVNLKNRNTISPEVIRQMRGFLSRAEKSSKISPENKGTPWNDKGYVAWLLWGGDPAKAWVDKIIRQMDAADEKEKGKTASRIASRFMAKRACIVARIPMGKTVALLKNRDRNYAPEVRVHHEIRNGVEILYMKDETTGWIEGINEFGIGIVNASLLVHRDENEKAIVKGVGKKSKDGIRVLAALEHRTLDEAVDSVVNHLGGVKGHTIVSDPKGARLVEMTSKHDAIVREMGPDELYVRTNHGIEYPDAGYTDGEDYVSSIARREQAIKVLDEVTSVKEIAPALYKNRRKDHADPYNMVRDTDNMRTVTQMVLDLTHRRMLLYLIPGKVKYLGYVNDLPDDHKPKVKFDVFKYTDIDGDGEFDVVRRKTKQDEDAPPSAKGGKGKGDTDVALDDAAADKAKDEGKKAALRVARQWLIRVAAKKKLRVFDFDETLAVSEGSISIKKADGEKITINSVTFTHYTAQPGDEFDFSDFNDLNHPRIIKKNWERFRAAVADAGSDVAILTARPKGVESSINKFLASHGIEGVRVAALQSSNPFDKARWIDTAIEKGGYEDVEFVDDSRRNVAAVAQHAEAQRKRGVRFETEQPPLPTESSFEGPPDKKVFRSDSPTKAVSTYSPPVDAPDKPGASKGKPSESDWWRDQTPDFQKHYCEEHPASRYCKSASERVVMSAKDPNAEVKKQIRDRGTKSKNKAVLQYLPHFIAKIDQANIAAGAWLENLEAHFDQLKAEGMLRSFDKNDLNDLFEVVYGYDRSKAK